MDWTISRRPGVDEANWAAIEEHRARLERAQRDSDWTLMVGAAKELAETVECRP